MEYGTSLGVKKFDFFKTELSQASYLQANIYKPKQIKTFLIDGLMQSKCYSKLPQVNTLPYCPIRSYSHIQNKYFLDFQGEDWPKIIDPSSTLLAIGPERGWSDKERQTFKANDFKPISIHQSVLKTELAIYCALSQLEYLHKTS